MPFCELLGARLTKTETFDVGQDTGTPVSKDYDRDNEFTGALDRVVFNLDE